jgi:hypothetical protein
VKQQLQDCIKSATDDQTFVLELVHNPLDRLRDNEEPIVWNEPILDRSWEELEAEIDQQRQQEIDTDIHNINITNVEIEKDRLAAFVSIFRSGRATNSSACVRFDNANLCGEGITWLA